MHVSTPSSEYHHNLLKYTTFSLYFLQALPLPRQDQASKVPEEIKRLETQTFSYNLQIRNQHKDLDLYEYYVRINLRIHIFYIYAYSGLELSGFALSNANQF